VPRPPEAVEQGEVLLMPRDMKRHKENQRAWYLENKARQDAYAKAWRAKERLRLIADFGGCCVECGVSDPVVLDFDHVDNDGHKGTGKNLIFEVKSDPTRFQLLCKNCNWRKEYWRRKGDAEQNAEAEKSDGSVRPRRSLQAVSS
jgi:hypothetical protein